MTAMSTRVITPNDALVVARAWFLEGRTVDMLALADELAIGRATLYRVVGSRERLLGDVVASLALPTMAASLARARDDGLAPGVDRLVGAARIMNHAVMGFAPLRAFLTAEPEIAFKVLFMPAAQVHLRIVEAWQQVLAAAVARGDLAPDADPERLAYLFVRIGESMIYADLLAGREPDLDLAATLQRSLLAPAPV
ncbi:TetR/AcrR family transcriptional regulator [Mumia zhuanghuii]|uniref:QsdR family transcriptional regulator n=2 Tax=Mumia TaxID=1546255 RepID=A0ABW1QGQ9_9ACTN|nr:MULTISPECIES: QsdR family transcriptional regulator [Mumia]KAA1424781.1 TetR/AcrR family transcriptional regulator [Mumia zhuanghuii]